MPWMDVVLLRATHSAAQPYTSLEGRWLRSRRFATYLDWLRRAEADAARTVVVTEDSALDLAELRG